ncbi:MAG: Rpp14/Pop5 family protein [Methanobacteriota archaeon]
MRLRPSMRENFRYMLTRISSHKPPHEAKEIYLAASESYRTLFGEGEAARTWVAVMETTDMYTIFRYRRGSDKHIEAALSAVCFIGGVPCVIHPVLISGTIRTLREKIKKNPICSVRTGKIKQGEFWHPAEICSSGRIDLKEKGINLQIPLYITEEDIEDLYYDE